MHRNGFVPQRDASSPSTADGDGTRARPGPRRLRPSHAAVGGDPLPAGRGAHRPTSTTKRFGSSGMDGQRLRRARRGRFGAEITHADGPRPWGAPAVSATCCGFPRSGVSDRSDQRIADPDESCW